jgi:hypothetical protein
MNINTKIALAAALFAALASPALAHDEWLVNSGRYVNGAVPSYETHGSFYMTTRAPRLIEGRNAAYFAHSGWQSGRHADVQALGN